MCYLLQLTNNNTKALYRVANHQKAHRFQTVERYLRSVQTFWWTASSREQEKFFSVSSSRSKWICYNIVHKERDFHKQAKPIRWSKVTLGLLCAGWAGSIQRSFLSNQEQHSQNHLEVVRRDLVPRGNFCLFLKTFLRQFLPRKLRPPQRATPGSPRKGQMLKGQAGYGRGLANWS